MDMLTNYLQTTSGDAASNITGMLVNWIAIPSIIFMIFIVAIYTFRTVHRHKVDAAILEIRDTLREMNTPSVPESHEPLPPEK